MCSCDKPSNEKTNDKSKESHIQKLHHHTKFVFFNKNDPEFISKTHATNHDSNLKSHTLVKRPIYNKNNVKIGNKVSDDYIKQVANNKYIVKLTSKYIIDGIGTIKCRRIFYNSVPTINYPLGVPIVFKIISGTGIFKDMIGKDLSKFSLPVFINEPTNILMKPAEFMFFNNYLTVFYFYINTQLIFLF